MGKLLRSYNELSTLINKDILYHGTLDIYKESIKETISLNHSLETKDFGKGFYLTTNFVLAKNTAERNSKRYNRRKINESKPIVLEFLVKEEYTKEECNILYFDKCDEEWFGFICANKNPNQKISELFTNNWKSEYSIIYGPLADGVLGYMKNVEELESEQASTDTKSEFLRKISQGFEFPINDQIVFKDEVLANKMLILIEP